MRLINVAGHLFNEDESRFRVDGEPVILDGDEQAKEYARRHGFDLIGHEEYRREQEDTWNRFIGPPQSMQFDFDERWPLAAGAF